MSCRPVEFDRLRPAMGKEMVQCITITSSSANVTYMHPNISLFVRNWWKKTGMVPACIRCIFLTTCGFYMCIYRCILIYFYIHISRPKKVHVPGGFWPFGKDEPRVIDASLAQLCHTGVDSKVFQLRFPRLWMPLKFNKKNIWQNIIYIYMNMYHQSSCVWCHSTPGFNWSLLFDRVCYLLMQLLEEGYNS